MKNKKSVAATQRGDALLGCDHSSRPVVSEEYRHRSGGGHLDNKSEKSMAHGGKLSAKKAARK